MKPSNDIAAIFTQYRNRVYRLAVSITRNEKDAEDVTQNTFIKIIKNLSSFRNESLLSTWIYKIAYNEALMYLRKRKSQFRLSNYLSRDNNKLSSGLFVNWAKLPDAHLLDGELKERISGAISQLPLKYRMVLLLDNVEGLPQRQSARILGIGLNSLKTRLHRAHLMLKGGITDYYKDKEMLLEQKSRKCGIQTGFLYEYAKGQLGKTKTSAFMRHIRDCGNCTEFLDSYQKAIAITSALECQDLPQELVHKIASFLSKRSSKKH